MGETTGGGIGIESTTANPVNIKVPDVDYAYILVIKDLIQAIKQLTRAMNKN